MKKIASKTISRRLFACAFAGVLAFALVGFAGCSSSESDEGQQPDPNAPQVTVTVEVDASSQEGGAKESAQVSVPEGASVMDALEATEFDYVVEDGQYGAYITSMMGIETGTNSGWVYSINGESGMEAADVAVVADGDVVTWEFMTF